MASGWLPGGQLASRQTGWCTDEKGEEPPRVAGRFFKPSCVLAGAQESRLAGR